MNGFMNKAVAVLGLAGALSAGGCYTYRDLVDPCYPERYQYMARQEVRAVLAPQVQNGHVLDQTVWNYHFQYDEAKQVGTDKLTPAGIEHLAYVVRRRPHPDPMVYLQTAHDLGYDAANPDKYIQVRTDLDTRRTDAVKKALASLSAGRGFDFQVIVHDPGKVGQASQPAALSLQRSYAGAQGVLSSVGGAGASNVSGGGGSGGGR